MAAMRSDARLTGFALIAVGGFLGATLRYGIGGAVSSDLPVGTLAANVLGSFVLGVVLSDSRLAGGLSDDTRLLVGTGFCSSLTTYSTFAAETASLAPVLAGGYVVATYALGLAAVLAGHLVAGWAS